MKLARAAFTSATSQAYCNLFERCFPGTRKFTHAYLQWLYMANPDGPVVGFDAWDGDQLAAHYACVPASARLDGRTVRVLLSLNTATAPAYQGQGLFTRLAEKTYQAAADEGITAVYGVANANSTPGFVRKLGFDRLASLEARVGLGRVIRDHAEVSRRAQFERVWNPATLSWRCANPTNLISITSSGETTQLHAAALGVALSAYAELPRERAGSPAGGLASEGLTGAQKRRLTPLRLYLGLLPSGADHYGAYVSVPNRLRPSPLNFIYKPLSAAAPQLKSDGISFSFLDFDAY